MNSNEALEESTATNSSVILSGIRREKEAPDGLDIADYRPDLENSEEARLAVTMKTDRLLFAITTACGLCSMNLIAAEAATTVYQPRTFAKISGATIVASDSIINFGVSTLSFPHVIFSLGTAPEYDPKLVVESPIWQK